MGFWVERLRQTLSGNTGWFDADAHTWEAAASSLDESIRDLGAIELQSMFGGKTDDAIHEAAKRFRHLLEEHKGSIQQLKALEPQGGGYLQQAQTAFHSLPSASPNPAELAYGSLPIVNVAGALMPGAVYLEGVRQMREYQRELQAQAAVGVLSQQMTHHATAIKSVELHHEEPFEGEGGGDQNGNGDGEGNGDGSGNAGPGGPVNASNLLNHISTFGSPVPGVGAFTPGSQYTPNPNLPNDTSSQVPASEYPVGAAPRFPHLEGPPVEYPQNTNLPHPDQWPFSVNRGDDVSRDGPLDGGYRTPLDSREWEMPRDPVMRDMIDKQQRSASAGLGIVGGAAVLGGAAAMTAASRGGMGASVPTVGMGGAAPAGAAPVAPRGGVGGPAAGAGAGAVGGGAGGAGAPRGGVGGGMVPGGVAGGGAAGGNNSQSNRSRSGGTRGGAFGARGGVGGAGGARGGLGTAGGGVGGAARGGLGAGAPGAGGAGAGGTGRGGVSSGLAAGSAGSGAGGAGARGGMMAGGPMGGAGGADEETSKRRKRRYGRSGVEFFELTEHEGPGAEGDAGAVDATVIPVVDAEDDRW